jgi:hypothetical protein
VADGRGVDTCDGGARRSGPNADEPLVAEEAIGGAGGDLPRDGSMISTERRRMRGSTTGHSWRWRTHVVLAHSNGALAQIYMGIDVGGGGPCYLFGLKGSPYIWETTH